MERTYSLDQIDEVAQAIVALIKENVITLTGEMGAGKTTLIKALCKALNCSDTVSSPTFSLINEYRNSSGNPLYHFDCYRIENEEEAFDFGAEEYLFSNHICLVEWPENIANLLPDQHHKINLEKIDASTRKIQFI